MNRQLSVVPGDSIVQGKTVRSSSVGTLIWTLQKPLRTLTLHWARTLPEAEAISMPPRTVDRTFLFIMTPLHIDLDKENAQADRCAWGLTQDVGHESMPSDTQRLILKPRLSEQQITLTYFG